MLLGNGQQNIPMNLSRLLALVICWLLPCVGHAQLAIWGAPGAGQQNIPATATNLVDVDLGAFHALALRRDGIPVAWGASVYDYGQTNVPAAATNIISVAAGSYHSLGLRADGTVIAWGSNQYFQCYVPGEATNVIAIAAGLGHCLALRNDGTVVGWGYNDKGQAIPPARATNIVAIAAGGGTSMALQGDGRLMMWGSLSTYPELNPPAAATNVIAMACEGANLAVRADGTAVRWGVLDYVFPTPYPVPTDATNIISAATGYETFLVLRADGYPVQWGNNDYGQLNGFPGGRFAAVASSYMTSAGLRGEGLPVIKPVRTNRIAHAGETMIFPATAVGKLPLSYQWYRNGMPIENGNSVSLVLPNVQADQSGTYQLVVSNEVGVTTSQRISVTINPQPAVPTPPTDRTLSLGSSICISGAAFGAQPLTYQWEHDGVIINQSGPDLCFNQVGFSDAGTYRLTVSNDFGAATYNFKLAVTPIIAVGTGSFTNIPLSATNIAAVAAGKGFGMALRNNGTVVVWGSLPEIPPSVTNITAIAAGDTHYMALQKGGRVICWGNNGYSQTNVPPSATNIVAIAAVADVSMALRADGIPIVWGNTNSQAIPTSATNLIGIAAGTTRGAGIRKDGTVAVWGFNDYGLLSPPASATNVVDLALGQYHNFALRNDGVIVPWGSYYYIPPSATNIAALASVQVMLRQDGNVIVYNKTQPPAFATNAIAVSDGSAGYLILLGDGRPHFTQLPGSIAALAGDTIDFQCMAVGSGTLTYQWQFNGTNLAGATAARLVITNAQPADVGAYTIIVSNALGSTSATAMLGIPGAPLWLSGSTSGVTDGRFIWQLRGVSGRNRILISASTDLRNWFPVYTNAPAIGVLEFVDPTPYYFDRRFYRAREITSP